MLIIVEGIDRVGKTTLINKLHEKYNIPVFDDKYLKFNAIVNKNEFIQVKTNKTDVKSSIINIERMNSLTNYLSQFGVQQNILIDRFHISEYVYSKVERNFDGFEAFKIIDDRLSKLGTIIIYVRHVDLDFSSSEHGKDLNRHAKEFDKIMLETKCRLYLTNYNLIDKFVCEFGEII